MVIIKLMITMCDLDDDEKIDQDFQLDILLFND